MLAPCCLLDNLFLCAEWGQSCRRRVRGLEEEAAAQKAGQAAAQQGGCSLSLAPERQPSYLWPGGAAHQAELESDLESGQESSLKLLPCRAGCAGVLKEAGLGTHGSLFHLLWSVQLARRSCHFFPGRVEPVSLVQCAAEPRPIMKRAVMYLLVGALDLWEGRGWGARRLYILSLPVCRNFCFSQRAVTVRCCRVISHLLSTVSNRGYGAISQAQIPKGRLFISRLFFYIFMLLYLGTSNAPAFLEEFSGWNCQLSWLCPVAFGVFPWSAKS